MRASDLSNGEKLFVIRKRGGQSMAEASTGHGVSLFQYRRWENDEVDDVPKVAIGKLTQTDQYLILRRRSGKTAAELATEVGCCPWWLRQMEIQAIDDTRLREYWSA